MELIYVKQNLVPKHMAPTLQNANVLKKLLISAICQLRSNAQLIEM